MRLKKKSAALNCRIDQEAFELLEEFSQEQHISKTAVIEEAIRQYINSKREEKDILEKYRSGEFMFVRKDFREK